MTNALEVSEAEAAAVAKSPNRVSLASIEKRIVERKSLRVCDPEPDLIDYPLTLGSLLRSLDHRWQNIYTDNATAVLFCNEARGCANTTAKVPLPEAVGPSTQITGTAPRTGWTNANKASK